MASSSDKLRDASLDALALISAAARKDSKSVEAMLSTYRDDAESDAGERGMLLGGVLAHAVALIAALATARDCKPEDIVASVHSSIISEAK
jgi:hypothetical protein